MLQQKKKGRERFDPASWSLRDWKQIDWETFTQDALVCATPAFLFSAWISSDGVAEADADIYDGHDVNGRKLIWLYCNDEEMLQLNWFPPLYFAQGIYCNKRTNVKAIGFQYLREPRL